MPAQEASKRTHSGATAHPREMKLEGRDLRDLQSLLLTRLALPPPCHTCRRGVDQEGCIHPETKPPARPPTPARPLDDSRGRPRLDGRVPSSATVAAQPDRRNLLARGHLWASGESLSSSSGVDIQQQHGRTIRPFWPAPRAAAGLPPGQGGSSSTGERRGGDHFPCSAPPDGPSEPAPSP